VGSVGRGGLGFWCGPVRGVGVRDDSPCGWPPRAALARRHAGAVQARWRPMYSVIASRITSDDGTCRRLAKASTWSEISCGRRT
jgi:hypothetical protein